MTCPFCGHDPVVEAMRSIRIAKLEAALTEAIGIVQGGRNPESALNRKAKEWRSVLEEPCE